jgi:putative sterol carrier protein
VEETKGSAVESAKAFIAGGFGGVAAVLVGKYRFPGNFAISVDPSF